MKLHITVDGQRYEVEVEVADTTPDGPSYYPPVHARTAAAPAPPPGGAPDAASGGPEGAADDGKVCRSPLAGVVSRVEVEPGQEIAVDDVLLVLEAMKMETVVTAPFEGVVAAVNAAPGDAVRQGEVLVEIA
jgi:methylmalonyl-CoA carboxyltransferase small subunit